MRCTRWSARLVAGPAAVGDPGAITRERVIPRKIRSIWLADSFLEADKSKPILNRSTLILLRSLAI